MREIDFGTIMTLVKGKKPRQLFKEAQEGALPYVDIKAFELNEVQNYTDGVKCVPCDENDVLIVCDGSRSGLVGKGIKGYVGSTLAKVSAEGIIRDYLYYFLQSKYRVFNTHKKGTGTPHLNQELLKSQKIIILPIQQQQKIVSRIEELFSKLDKGVETLQTIKQQLAVYRQAVYSSNFNKIGDFRPIVDFFEISGGLTKNSKRQELPQQVPYLRVANVYYNCLELDVIKTIGVTEKELQKCSLKTSDLLFVEGNGSKSQIGRVDMWDVSIETCVHKNNLIRGRANGKILPKYALYYLISQEGRKQIIDIAKSTSGLYTLSINKVKNLQIPFCSRPEQETILNEIEARLSVCDSIEQTVDEALAQADAMRQSILKQAFEGKL